MIFRGDSVGKINHGYHKRTDKPELAVGGLNCLLLFSCDRVVVRSIKETT
jgi:hypothetical protein